MKRLLMLLSLSLLASAAQALEILRWERLPLPVSLVVDQERVIFVDRSIRVGMPPSLGEHLRVQSAGGALYLRAHAPIEPTRLQLQDANTGALILLDVTAKSATPGQEPLEPIRIIDNTPSLIYEDRRRDDSLTTRSVPANTATPLPVVLTRYAAQSLYAPLRTIEPANGIAPMPSSRSAALDTLLPTLPVHAKALAAWRLDDYWVTAVKLTNTGTEWIDLDPRALQGNFIAATFQHPNLGPPGDSTDTTVVYLVTRGSGLADALLPAVNPIDASINLPSAVSDEGPAHDPQK